MISSRFPFHSGQIFRDLFRPLAAVKAFPSSTTKHYFEKYHVVLRLSTYTQGSKWGKQSERAFWRFSRIIDFISPREYKSTSFPASQKRSLSLRPKIPPKVHRVHPSRYALRMDNRVNEFLPFYGRDFSSLPSLACHRWCKFNWQHLLCKTCTKRGNQLTEMNLLLFCCVHYESWLQRLMAEVCK